MGRQRVPVQLNQFIGGLNTEANPIGYPANATIDEENVPLLKDGSRRRRKGFDVEEGYVEQSTVVYNPSIFTGRSQYVWENAGGVPNKSLMVVQVGNSVSIHDLDRDAISSLRDYYEEFPTATYSNVYSYASVDGNLVIATGDKEVTVLSYDGTTVTSSSKSIKIRDLFGVDSGIGQTNSGSVSVYSLSDPDYLSLRPENLTATHLYNLRNQTFGPQRWANTDENSVDMVADFYDQSGSTVYPSNADNATLYIGPDANDSDNRTIDRFRSEDMFNTPPYNMKAPTGYFIIDFLERGVSRGLAEARLRSENSTLSLSVATLGGLPDDTTSGGATVLGQYAGRIWYGGFSSEVIDGDRLSPNLESYICFSQLVDDPTKITRCYQDADPTNPDDSNLVETDGGFIRLEGAYGINAMVTLQNSLFVFADNGVWQVSGGNTESFTATSYTVNKLSNDGCVGGDTVIRFEQAMLYWSQAGIFAVAQNEVGSWSVQNLTRESIQTIYNAIDGEDKRYAVGTYDLASDSFIWVYGNRFAEGAESKELIYNTKFQAWTKNRVASPASIVGPVSVVSGARLGDPLQTNVTDGGVLVTSGGEAVTTDRPNTSRKLKAPIYLVVTDISSTVKYTFGDFSGESPVDWTLVGDTVDTPAYLTSGPITGGDPRLQKEVPYLTTYFSHTEDVDLGDVESSCFASSRWDWKSSIDTNRWSTPRQMYRPKRITDGHDLVISRNRIRGRGRAVSFHFESEEGKTFRLYGWQHNLETGTEE